ncbi:MAG: hypothetical protein A2Y17_10815 [Clostridiales bacterium GWF2_38_85]|nr:MAG: hypothetical protein A2Y17_10815 [Clostridiales bacterium GWF2_38_85]HBL84618.1 hypothetical protein [Clostridiales bacterium]
MKKLLSILLVTLMVTTMFAGCGAKKEEVKTGLAVITSLSKSKDVTDDAAGLAEVDSTIVAVTVDANGKIIACVIDAAQTKINFDAEGKVTTDLATEFKTKNELGDDYGMKGNSSISKEWYEQAAALANYVEGKTVAEVKAIAVDEATVPTGDDLKSSVTISIGGFITAIEKAVTNAKALGAVSGDTLGLGVVTTIAKSKDATTVAEGLAQAYSNYTVVTKDSGGKITSCIIDASQGNVNFDAEGKISTDLSAEVKTKDELGDAYGMKAQSGIGKEWYEEAAAFASYVTGKTISDVKAIAVDEEGTPTGSDLTSSVTIGVGDFIKALEKATK